MVCGSMICAAMCSARGFAWKAARCSILFSCFQAANSSKQGLPEEVETEHRVNIGAATISLFCSLQETSHS